MAREGEFPTTKTGGFPARSDELRGRLFSRAVPLLQAPWHRKGKYLEAGKGATAA